MKLCKDCKHFYSGLQDLCMNPRNGTSPVNGESKVRWASVNRSTYQELQKYDVAANCGPEGAWFESIPVPQPKKSSWRKLFE